MKKIKSIQHGMLALLAALVAVGCSSEPETKGPVTGSSTITFKIPNVSKGKTVYSVGSVGDEDKLAHLDIYMFDKTDGTLEWVFRSADIGLSGSGADHTATIDVTERKGEKLFFFVGNGENISSKLNAARYGETTIEKFRAMLSDVQTTLPVTPLLMTSEKEMADITKPTDDEKKIEMTRRVARFDIHNDKTVTNFEINRIYIGNANLQGHFFADASRTEPAKMTTANIPDFEFGSNPGDNEGESKAVFYLYPTTLGDDQITDISLGGMFHDGERIYGVKLGNPVKIEPNKRYILKAKEIKINKIECEITVDPWEEGEDMESKPNDKGVTISTTVKTEGDGVLDLTSLSFPIILMTQAAEDTRVTFTASSFHKDNTRIEIRYQDGSANAVPITVNKVASRLTYAAHYEEDYEMIITKPKLQVITNAFIEVVSVADPRKREKIQVAHWPDYPGTSLPPVLLGGKWWAPVNCGATSINKTSTAREHAGYLHQWGRNTPFEPGVNPANKIEGPLTLTAFQQLADNTYIYTSTANCWSVVDEIVDLWGEDKSRGPCPEGWRIPSSEHMQLLVDAYNDPARLVGEMTINGVTLKGDDGASELYLPRTLNIGAASAIASTTLSNSAWYWCSDLGNPGYSRCLSITYNVDAEKRIFSLSSGGGQTTGIPLRCIAAE